MSYFDHLHEFKKDSQKAFLQEKNFSKKYCASEISLQFDIIKIKVNFTSPGGVRVKVVALHFM